MEFETESEGYRDVLNDPHWPLLLLCGIFTPIEGR